MDSLFKRIRQLFVLGMISLIGLPLGQAVTLFDYESSWKLWRGKTPPSRPDYLGWVKVDFDDSEWEIANTPVFFGEKVESGTELIDMKSKYNSFFLRQKFDCPNPENITSATFRAKADDGFVAYLNGTEVIRYNVETEIPKYNSRASDAAPEPLRSKLHKIPNFKSVLKNGENIISIAVLNQRRTSPDIFFDSRFTVVSDENIPPKVVSTDPPSGLISNLDSITVNFSEPIQGLLASDLLANGKPAISLKGTGRSWTFDLGAIDYGEVQLTWSKENNIKDQARKPNAFESSAEGSSWSYNLVDGNPPYIKRVNPRAGLTVKSLNSIEIEFNMSVEGVTAKDLLINDSSPEIITQLSESRYLFQLNQPDFDEVNISWAKNTNITGKNALNKKFQPTEWHYRVDANAPTPPRIVISEIMYHPIEEPEFDKNGKPMLDLTEDIHEFIELHNLSKNAVSLNNWRISGGIDYAFPQGTSIGSGEFLVLAKNPNRLATIKEYDLIQKKIVGPYEGTLSNNGERLRVENSSGDTEDSVNYSAQFPWPIGADSIGAGPKWTGIDPMNFQYRGSSLERINFSLPGDNPNNWVASPLEKNATPGKPNHIARKQLMPVAIVTSIKALNKNGSRIINKLDTVKIEAKLSNSKIHNGITLEYFYDDLEKDEEIWTKVEMDLIDGVWTYILPRKPDRTLVRYRILADFKKGLERISPRLGDPYKWHSYFVMPKTTSSNKYFELLVPRKGISQLSKNMSANPRSGYRPTKNIKPRGPWNDTVHGVLVHDGVVRDVYARWNGSFFRRNSARNSWKVRLPRYNRFDGQSDLMFTDKDNVTIAGHALYRELGLPTSHTEWVDVSINKRKMRRLMLEDHNDRMLEQYHEDQVNRNPGSELEPNGHIFKSSGILQNLGPYGRGDGSKLSPRDGWSSLQRYEWIYSSKNQDWKGHSELKELIDGLAKYKNNRTQLRKWFLENWDMNALMDYIAVRNWMGTWDDTVHNFYFWRRADGRWGMLPWDFDNDMQSSYVNKSIYIGEAGNSNTSHGTHPIKDAFFKAFREEYKEHLYHLNNTLLTPDNLKRIGLGSYATYARNRQISINKQCASVKVPTQPKALRLADGSSVYSPASMVVSTFEPGENKVEHESTIWAIRSSDGSFTYPVFKTESKEHLTKMPVPFELLEFGRTYYWQATFVDNKGRKSLPATGAIFRYGGHAESVNIITLKDTTWKYNAEGEDLGKDWRNNNYDDSAWKNGKTFIGRATTRQKHKMSTTLKMGPRTFYFRKYFNFDHSVSGAELQLQYLVDDGAAFYLNGKEIHRINMKERGAIRYTTRANSTVRDADISGIIKLSGKELKQGNNLLAVEVHQYSTNDSDLAFGTSLSATIERLPDGVIINELMAANRGSVQNGDSNPDWIELFNPTNRQIDLTGAGLGDSVNETPTYFFPNGTMLSPQSHLIIWCDGANNQPGLHSGFALDKDGQNIALWWPTEDGLKIQDAIGYGPQVDDLSIGRSPSGIGPWTLNKPSPGSDNKNISLGSMKSLSINEWMARPEDGSDWFEIYNKSLLPILLEGLRLSDDPTQPDKTIMPPLTFIAGRGFLKFIADNSTADGLNHSSFKLSGKGEEILLSDVNDKIIDSVLFSEQIRGVSEGRYPDGDETIIIFPNNSTPGLSNLIIDDTDDDGLPNLWENLYGLNPNDVSDAKLDNDNDGHNNLEEFLAGTQPNDESSVLWLNFVSHDNKMLLSFEAQPNRSYILWRVNDVSNQNWKEVKQFEPNSKTRTIFHEISSEKLNLPKGYYRLTIPVKVD